MRRPVNLAPKAFLLTGAAACMMKSCVHNVVFLMKSRVPNPCPAKSGPSPEISGPSPENSGPDFFKIFVKQVIFMMTSWNHAIMQIPPTFHRRHQGLLYIIKLQYPSSCINSWTPGILKYITCLLHHWYQFTVTFSFRGIQIILEHPGMNCRRVFYELDQVFLKNTHQLHSPMFHAQPVSTTSRKFLHGSVFGLERVSDPRLQMFFCPDRNLSYDTRPNHQLNSQV